MDITKARKVVELSKDNKKILVTLWESGQISSCVADEVKQHCETCQGDEGLCNEFIEHLKSQGYQATEVELAELEIEEGLPKFLEQREIHIKPKVVVETEEQVVTSEDVGKVEEINE